MQILFFEILTSISLYEHFALGGSSCKKQSAVRYSTYLTMFNVIMEKTSYKFTGVQVLDVNIMVMVYYD